MVHRYVGVPLIQIWGRSQNVQRRMCPSGQSESKDKAETIHHYIDRDEDDFVCI